MNKKLKLRWVLQHEPIDLFQRTAENFAKEIGISTNGRIEIEILNLFDHMVKNNLGAEIDPIDLIAANEADMSQVQDEHLGRWEASDFYAFDLPYLFSSHEHATRVFDGKIGQDLLNGLADVTPVTGLGFTYSGGYRAIAATKQIKTADDLIGLEIVINTNPVMVDTAEAFGCKATSIRITDRSVEARAARSKMAAVDTTLPRYRTEANPDLHKFVTNTKHSMFLTTIIIGTDIWKEISPEDQVAMRAAALSSAAFERQWTIDQGDAIANSVDLQHKLGFSFSEFDETEAVKLRERANVVYEKYTQFFSPGLIDGIIRA
jgi:TRAP-type C4-dicarboxylate transport system substrate-binding protein